MPTQPVMTASGPEGVYVPTWTDIEATLERAEMYWLTTLDHGVPHTVPVIGVWWEGAWYACSPRSERKYANLRANPTAQVLTGCSRLNAGMDVCLHGRVEEIPGMEDRLRYARQMAEKYPEPWRFEGTEQDMWVFSPVPAYVRAFHRLDPVSSARWDVPTNPTPSFSRSNPSMEQTMSELNVITVLAGIPVRNMDQAIAWFTRLFGRGPDARPMESLADWHIGSGFTVQVVHDESRAGGGMVTLQVEDISGAQETLSSAGIEFTFDDQSSTKVKFGTLTDPDGNSVTIVEALPGFNPGASS